MRLRSNQCPRNNRPIQNLNNRDIFYTAVTGPEKKEKTAIQSNNRYLKCEKREILDQVLTTSQVVLKSPAKDYGLSESALSKLKQMSLLVITVLLFVSALFFVKFLFKH